MVWGLNLKASLAQVPSSLALLGFYLAATSIRYKKNELQAITYLAILGGCVAAAYSAYLFSQGNYYEMGETRASLIVNGRATNPDGLAMTLLLPISFAFAYFLSAKRMLRKTLMLGVIALTCMGLFLTMSRGAVLGLVTVIGVYVYRLKLGRKLVAPLILLSIVLCFMPSVFFARFVEASQSGGSGRTNIWKVGLVAFKHYGFYGAGFNNFPFAYTKYVNASPKFEGVHRDPHNVYLAIAVEAGILGLFLSVAPCAANSRLRHKFESALLPNICWSLPRPRPVACSSTACLEISCGINRSGLPGPCWRQPEAWRRISRDCSGGNLKTELVREKTTPSSDGEGGSSTRSW